MFLALRFRGQHSQRRLCNIARLCSAYVPLGFSPLPRIWFNGKTKTAVLHWTRTDENSEQRLLLKNDEALVLDGYVTEYAPNGTQASIVRSMIDIDGERLKIKRSCGGVAAFAWSTGNHLYAWSTQPSAQGLY